MQPLVNREGLIIPGGTFTFPRAELCDRLHVHRGRKSYSPTLSNNISPKLLLSLHCPNPRWIWDQTNRSRSQHAGSITVDCFTKAISTLAACPIKKNFSPYRASYCKVLFTTMMTVEVLPLVVTYMKINTGLRFRSVRQRNAFFVITCRYRIIHSNCETRSQALWAAKRD